MKRSLIAAMLAAAAASGAFAQAPSGEWKGAVSVGASFAQSYADVRNTNIGIAADTSRTTTIDKTSLYFTTIYGKTKAGGASAETANNMKLGGRYEWNLSPQMYAFGALDFERDRVAGLDLRSALGVGLGYYFVKSEPLTFTVFAGVGYRNDDYRSGGSDNFTELLIGEESNHKLSSDVSFKQRLVLYPNLSETGEMRAAFDATLAVKLAGAWNLNLSLIERYDSLAGPRKHDTAFLIGVGAKFGK